MSRRIIAIIVATFSVIVFFMPVSNGQIVTTRNNSGQYWINGVVVTSFSTARTEIIPFILDYNNNNYVYIIEGFHNSPHNQRISVEQDNADDNNTITNTDLIDMCFVFRNILSETGRKSCDHSMLYYKGQCEYYSAMNKSDIMLNSLDFIFCSNPEIDMYINRNNLTHSPRSSRLIQ